MAMIKKDVSKQSRVTHEGFFAEVIESSLDFFLAQSWDWDSFPCLGRLVSVGDGEQRVIGIVHHIQTGSIDPVRSPFVYKKTEEELKTEQPQIFELLKTTFRVVIVGHCLGDKIYYVLPCKPCKIHAFVQDAYNQLEAQFFSRSDFLHLLFACPHISSIDELLLAVIQELKGKNLLTDRFFEEFCQTFSLLIGNDYRRFKLFLQRIEQIC